MTTFTTYENGTATTANSGANPAGYPDATVLVGEFDADRRNLAAADVVEVLNVPAGTYVYNVFYEVVTGDATQTMNVGDGADPDGWVAAADVATAGNKGIGAGALAGGKFYSAADTIDIEVPATKALDTLKVKIYAHAVVLGVAG